jgi:hypothetical protein
VLLIEQKLTIAMTISDRTLVMGHGASFFRARPTACGPTTTSARSGWRFDARIGKVGGGLHEVAVDVHCALFRWLVLPACGLVLAFVPGGTKEHANAGRTLYNQNRTTVLFLLSKEQQHDR